jgi:hypothetical protein
LETVIEGDEVKAAVTEGSTRVSKGFCSTALDGSATSGSLRHKTHQHINKLECKENRRSDTSAPAFSSVESIDVSSVVAYHLQQQHLVTFGETLQICVQKLS